MGPSFCRTFQKGKDAEDRNDRGRFLGGGLSRLAVSQPAPVGAADDTASEAEHKKPGGG